MARTTGFLTKDISATTAILANRLVKLGAVDETVVPAVDGAATIIGASADLDTAVGERCSVFMVGNIVPVKFGGTITLGASVTAGALGVGVAAATPGQRCAGFSMSAGVSGDIGFVLLAPHPYAAAVA